MRENLSFSEARNLILSKAKPLRPERLPLIESLNKVLATDIYSNINIPPFDNSAMDGYAVISSDTKGASPKKPVFLKVIGDISAGYGRRINLKDGCAIKIATGAPVPIGCDAVIRKEDVELIESNTIKVSREYKQGEDIRRRGEDIKNGELLLKKGTLIGKFEIGILASVGKKEVMVYPPPKVGIISTGNEVVEIGEKLPPGKIYNSNAYTLYGLIKEAFAEPVYFGIVKDEFEALEDILKKAAKICDIIITSGGVSVGEYDIVKDVVKKIGKIEIWKVKIRPGHPLVYGNVYRKIFFGLPGNPVSVAISFLQFVLPVILKMSGKTNLFLDEREAIFDENIKKKKGLRYFLRGKSYLKDGVLHCRTTGPQGSGILKSLLLADILLVLDENVENLKEGEKVKVQFL